MQSGFRIRSLCAAMIVGLGAPGALLAVASGAAENTTCLTEEQKTLVGQELDAVQDSLPETARIIPPDSAVTQDYRPERINVDLDEDGLILRVWCG